MSLHDLVELEKRDPAGVIRLRPDFAKTNRPLLLRAVAADGLVLEELPEWTSDREVVMTAVEQNGRALRTAGIELRKDRAITSAAIAENPLALEYAGDNIRSDRAIVASAVGRDGMALRHAAAELLRDIEIVKSAVQQNGLALQFALAPLRRHAGIVLLAVAQNPAAIEFAAPELQEQLRHLGDSAIPRPMTQPVAARPGGPEAVDPTDRARMTPDELERIGLRLNNGRHHGWRTIVADHLNALGTLPRYMPQRVAEWARGDRPIPMPVAQALRDIT